MFKPGDIVNHDFLIFHNGWEELLTEKKRPCIVLYVTEYNGIEFIVSAPCTSQVKTFNKHPENYFFVPEKTVNKKYSFIRYENISIHLASNTHLTSDFVSENTVYRIIDKALNYNGLDPEVYELLYKEKEQRLEKERSEKHHRKMMRKLKRKGIDMSYYSN